MLNSLLLPMTSATSYESATKVAISLAKAHSARLEIFYIAPDPRTAVPFVGEGLTADVIQDICRNAEINSSKHIDDGRKYAESLSEKASIPMTDGHKRCEGGYISFNSVSGVISEHAGRRARLADVSVVAKPSADNNPDAHDLLEDILFRSGRAVLMVPSNYESTVGRHIVIAWNGRAECARAVAAAMPFLRNAYKITAVQIGSDDPSRPSVDDLTAYLNDHDIEATPITTPNDGSIGATLITVANDVRADMMVIGAYSHSRWREMILGGVTRHIIENTNLPVFMSH